MKKLAISLLLITTVLTNGFAQSEDEQKFHFGLKASPSFSWLRVEAKDVKNDGLMVGFTYGLMTEFNITKNYAFLTGVDVSYRGGKYEQIVSNLIDEGGVAVVRSATLNRKQNFQFIEIPLALKLKTNEIGYMKYYGMFGFSPGMIVKASEKIESSNQAVQPDRGSRSNQSDFLAFNISLNVGLGIEYSLGGSTAFTGGIHYTNGLVDIWDLDKSQMRSDGITINLGILF